MPGEQYMRDARGPERHLAIDPDVDAPRGRIAGEGDVAGADVAAAVARPEFRGRKFGDIDVVTPQHDLVDRRIALVDFDRRETAAHDLACRRDHVRGGQGRVETDRERIALLARAEHVAQHLHAEPVTGEPLEEEGRRLGGASGKKRDRGQLLDRVDRHADALELARCFDEREPFAQIAPRDCLGIRINR